MNISPFFLQLRSGYQAEIDDLTSDSEGKDVLRKRLAEKRKEIGFLVKMIELSPEMVAVVLHQAFKFREPAVLDHLLSLESEELVEWDALVDAVEIAPWANSLVQTILKEPMGEWFMAVAVALEYMFSKPIGAAEQSPEDESEDGGADRDEERDHRHDDTRTEDHDEEEQEARAREEAGNDWLEAQGFDRKD